MEASDVRQMTLGDRARVMFRSLRRTGVVLVLAGCSNPGVSPSPAADNEAGIYLAVLEHTLDENPAIAYPRTVAPPDFFASPPPGLLRLLNVDSMDLAGIAESGDPLPPGLKPILDEEQAERFEGRDPDFFRASASGDKDWSAVVRFSSAVFDAEGRVLLYYNSTCGWQLCAGGYWVVLDRLEGEWVVIASKIVFRS